MGTHYFLAISLPKEVKNAIAAWRAAYEGELPLRTWVHRDDYHITLVFLGDVAASKLTQIEERLQLLSSLPSFSLTLQGLGVFGLPERPRIVWAGVTEPSELFSLQKRATELFEELGFSLEARPYRPHITIGRKWCGEKPLQGLSDRALPSLLFSVQSITLYKTNLKSMPKYEEIFQIILNNC